MGEFLTKLLIIVISIAIIAGLICWIDPLVPFGYSPTFFEWVGIVVTINLLKQNTNTKED